MKLKEGMEVKVKSGTCDENCSINGGDCSICLKRPIIMKKLYEGDDTLVPWDGNGKGSYCASIPKNCLIPVNVSWRSQYENRD